MENYICFKCKGPADVKKDTSGRFLIQHCNKDKIDSKIRKIYRSIFEMEKLNEKKLIKAKEAAKLLGFSYSYIKYLVQNSLIPYVKLRSRIFIYENDIDNIREFLKITRRRKEKNVKSNGVKIENKEIDLLTGQ